MAVFNLRERSPGGPAWIQATRAIRVVKATQLWDGFTFTRDTTLTETSEWVDGHLHFLQRETYTNQRITATINGETIVVTEYPDGYYEERFLDDPWLWYKTFLYWECSNLYAFNQYIRERNVTMIGSATGDAHDRHPQDMPWLWPDVAHTHEQLHEMLFPSGGPFVALFMIPLTISSEHTGSHKSLQYLEIDYIGPLLSDPAPITLLWNDVAGYWPNAKFVAAEATGHWAAQFPIVIQGTGLDGQPLTQSITLNDIFVGAPGIDPPLRENSITSIT